MANYTANYGLHQWEPEDNFLRTDFNADFAKMDTALGRLERGLEQNSYHIYNLILQNYYENKYTGYKKALLFDGFLTKQHIATSDPELMIGGGAARLYRAAEVSWSQARGSSANSPYSAQLSTVARTSVGAGTVTAVTFTVKESDTSRTTCTLQITLNGKLAREQAFTVPNGSTGTCKVELTTPLEVKTGDQYRFQILNSRDVSPSLSFYLTSDYTTLAVTAHVTSQGAQQAVLTAAAPTVLSFDHAKLWLRHQGGIITPTLNGVAMTLVGTEATTEPLGNPCTERCWTAPGGSAVNLALTLDCGTDDTCFLYDYGLLLF